MTATLGGRVMRGVLATTFAAAALAITSPVAYAQQAARVGWWNTVTVAGLPGPAPTTPQGGLHIAAAPGQVLAYGAVLYAMPVNTTGSLTLAIAQAQGTVALQACPTKSINWPGGGDQPSDKAPTYDCNAARDPGTVSADGSTVTFRVATFATTSAGRLSLAITPDLTANQPFSVDIDKPSASSLTVTGSPPPPPPTATPTGQAAAPSHPSTTSQSAAGRPLGVPAPPALPPATTNAPSSGPAPQVAPSTPAAAPGATPVASGNNRSAASTAGSVIGVLAIIAALLFWGLGRGLLGGKIPVLSSPVDRLSSG
jgi:hypothetical protein